LPWKAFGRVFALFRKNDLIVEKRLKKFVGVVDEKLLKGIVLQQRKKESRFIQVFVIYVPARPG
jgi:hypothetical protein